MTKLRADHDQYVHVNVSQGAGYTSNTGYHVARPINNFWAEADPSQVDGMEGDSRKQIATYSHGAHWESLIIDWPHQDTIGPAGTKPFKDKVSQMTPLFQYQSPKLRNELPLPSTYGHYETSFARRLIRSTAEESYILLMNAGSRPEDIRRLTTYGFCFINAPKLLQLFHETMKRTTRDNMEHWAVPLYHVGNAGFHYPRVGIDASSEPPSWWADRGSMGPQPAPQPETPVPKGIIDIMEHCGVEGEWFDSNDVVEYLRSRGLNLDVNSVIVEINDAQKPISQLSHANTESRKYGDYGGQTPITQSQAPDLKFDTGFAEPFTLNDQLFAQSLGLPVVPESMVMKKYLGVEKFVRYMYPGGAALRLY